MGRYIGFTIQHEKYLRMDDTIPFPCKYLNSNFHFRKLRLADIDWWNTEHVTRDDNAFDREMESVQHIIYRSAYCTRTFFYVQ